ncbi:MAG: hypothetical protein IKD79_05115, partial [Oscillospiraceae bacterium]|nr:hypothetical protein [Oscillospiraceae bacterium]
MLLAALLLLGPVSCGSRTDAPAGGTDAPVSAPAATDDTGEETPAESPAGPAEEEMPAETTVPAEEETPAETTAEPSSAQPEESPGRTLVAVFSATGHTRGVAEKIAAITGADLYEIRAAQEYTEDDLNWNDGSSRTTAEQNDKSARPEIGGEPLSLDGYSTVFVGYPIWWGEEPRIMDTFVESCDFDGVTVIPFCTSGSSGIGSSGRNLAENAGSGAWLEGARFAADATEEEIRSWIDGLGLEERAETAMVLTIGDTEVPVTWEDNASVSAVAEG